MALPPPWNGVSPLDGGVSPGKISDIPQPVNLTQRIHLGDAQRRGFDLRNRKRVFLTLEFKLTLPPAIPEQQTKRGARELHPGIRGRILGRCRTHRQTPSIGWTQIALAFSCAGNSGRRNQMPGLLKLIQ